MSWLILIVSGVLESVWALALGRSDGLSKLGPTITFFIALAASMFGLAIAMRDLPTSTAYAVWVGIGATLTAAYSMISGAEAISVVRILLVAGIVGCVVGLKLAH
ncbi:DMT family transporter [Rarobacter incanus]|uniref:Quaternary ammonium compound-resistance protein SugE n=1 Tax=Rarobacter incanus TaxID=153494 RepID=A0A542SMN4_9MICO|nr:multidrug efflux SMR transporter [Rarobacter incanus]TQK75883.1 quaternary ammonium compound-resistance protein SugE [Rarobacter incanus]